MSRVNVVFCMRSIDSMCAHLANIIVDVVTTNRPGGLIVNLGRNLTVRSFPVQDAPDHESCRS
jgi:hypothetical protein